MIRATRTTRIGTLAGAGLLAAAILSSCGGEDPAAGPSTGSAVAAPNDSAAGGNQAAAPPATTSVPAGPHNEADIAFASGMIPHNVQALASTQIATSKAAKPAVKAMASSISAAQVPQIEKLSSWLTGWGQAVPGGAIPQGKVAGISQSDLVELSKATTGFDELWLTTMIKHQTIALTLAQNEVKSGSNLEAKDLAQNIVKEQQAEITAMQTMLKTA